MKNKILLLLCTLITSVSTAQLTQPEWSKNAVMYELNVRQYSQEGTFKAVTKDLARIKSLGVDVIWVMPVHPIGEAKRKGKMGSYYSVKDYMDVAPEYGSKNDFKELVQSAHALGMKVIIDWVANHTSWDNEWLNEHRDWYVQDANGNVITQYDWTDVAKLNYENMEMREAMINAMKYWVTDFDIDGFRCDVAFLVPQDFWETLRERLQEIKPIYMLAEMEWNADITMHPDQYFTKAFNASYGWNFMGVTADYALGKKSLKEMKVELQKNYNSFPAYMHKLFFLTNHDENSWNGTIDEKYGKNWQQFGVMVYTLPQSLPLIYTGEEVGLKRRLSFFEKDPITKLEWSNKSREAWYKKMTTLKHDVPAFHNTGDLTDWMEIPLISGDDEAINCYAYKRQNGNSTAYVFINFSEKEQMIKSKLIDINLSTKGFKMESNAIQLMTPNGLSIKPNSYIIYYK